MKKQESSFLTSAIKQFEYYKKLGEGCLERIPEDAISWQPNKMTNSMATLVKHLSGNILSRWTDFLQSDGEKSWRNRDDEFVNDITTKAVLYETWHKGWAVLFETLRSLRTEDLQKIVYIRNQGQSVIACIHRQLCHYSYHVGQMIFIGKQFLGEEWESLTIPLGASDRYNAEKFSKSKRIKHFTDEKD